MQLVYDDAKMVVFRMRAWIDMTLMSLTFFLTIIWSVQVGVTVSLIISLLLLVRRSSRTRMAILVRVSSNE
jgi:MFS superfamily sulfate permease-like transporter